MSNKDVDLTIDADSKAADSVFDKLFKTAKETAEKISESFREASYNMAKTMKDSAESIKSEYEKLDAVAKKLNGAMLAVTAALGGGAAFKKAVEETVNMTKESTALSKALGITVTQASILNVALDDVHITSEEMLAANKAMTKQLVNNEDAFKSLGVATRDQNGNYRNSQDIMLDVNKRLLEFKEGTDRNVEGTKIYGKAWSEVQGTLKLTPAAMDAARNKAEELGLVIGQENVAASKRYKDALNDVGDVFKAINKAISDALLPILSQLGEWFAATGPAAVWATKAAIGGLAMVINGLILIVKLTADTCFELFDFMMAGFNGLGQALSALASGKWSELPKIVKATWQEIKDSKERAEKEMVADVQETQDKILALFSKPTPTTAKTGGETSDGKAKKDHKAKSRTGEFEAALNELKLANDRENEANNTFLEFGKAQERDYWQTVLNTQKLSAEERKAVELKLHDALAAIRKEAGAAELDAIKKSVEAHKAGSVERIQAEGDAAARIGEKFGIKSKEYRKALEDMHKAAEERNKQQEKLDQLAVDAARQHDLALLDMQRERLGLSKSLGEISAVQELQALKKLKEQQFQIELQAEQDKVQLLEGDAVAYQAALDKLAQIKAKHELDMQKMNSQITLENKKQFEQMFAPLTSAFQKSVDGIIQGTTSIQKAMSNMAKSVVLEFVNMGVKIAAQTLANQLFQKSASAATISTKAAEATGVVGANAAEAASGAAASQASIPYVGWGLAAAAFTAVMSMVMGAKTSIPSAAGGYDIPAGVNPMTQLHQNEMVLPASLANTVRNMSDGGGSGAPIYINSTGGDWIHKNDLAKLLKQMGRDFVPVR